MTWESLDPRSAVWVPYDADTAAVLEAAYNNKEESVSITVAAGGRTLTFIVDFLVMVQSSATTRRRVRRQEDTTVLPGLPGLSTRGSVVNKQQPVKSEAQGGGGGGAGGGASSGGGAGGGGTGSMGSINLHSGAKAEDDEDDVLGSSVRFRDSNFKALYDATRSAPTEDEVRDSLQSLADGWDELHNSMYGVKDCEGTQCWRTRLCFRHTAEYLVQAWIDPHILPLPGADAKEENHPDGQSIEVRAAWIYTSTLFWVVNAAVKQDNRDVLRCLMPLIRLINLYISLNPPTDDITCTRGARLGPVFDQFAPGQHYRLSQFVSTTSGDTPAFDKPCIMRFSIPAQCRNAADISALSAFPSEGEVLLPPHTIVLCNGKSWPPGGKPILHLTVAQDNKIAEQELDNLHVTDTFLIQFTAIQQEPAPSLDEVHAGLTTLETALDYPGIADAFLEYAKCRHPVAHRFLTGPERCMRLLSRWEEPCFSWMVREILYDPDLVHLPSLLPWLRLTHDFFATERPTSTLALYRACAAPEYQGFAATDIGGMFCKQNFTPLSESYSFTREYCELKGWEGVLQFVVGPNNPNVARIEQVSVTPQQREWDIFPFTPLRRLEDSTMMVFEVLPTFLNGIRLLPASQ